MSEKSGHFISFLVCTEMQNIWVIKADVTLFDPWCNKKVPYTCL